MDEPMYGNSSAIKVKRRVPVKKNSNDRTSVPLDKVAVVTVHKKFSTRASIATTTCVIGGPSEAYRKSTTCIESSTTFNSDV